MLGRMFGRAGRFRQSLPRRRLGTKVTQDSSYSHVRPSLREALAPMNAHIPPNVHASNHPSTHAYTYDVTVRFTTLHYTS